MNEIINIIALNKHTQTMEAIDEKVKILLSLPADFSRLLDRMLLDLKDQKVNMTKTDLAIKLMRIGYLQEAKQIKK
jgi:hypothetical protein